MPLLLPLLLALGPAWADGADPPPRERRAPKWDASGEARLRLDSLAPIGLDELGTEADLGPGVSGRLIAGLSGNVASELWAAAEIEALNGGYAGGTTGLGRVGADQPFPSPRHGPLESGLLPRVLRLGWRGEQVQAAVGLDTFSWGLGLLANDGVSDNDFGDGQTGSVNARIRVSTSPWKPKERAGAARGLAAFVAADQVIRDDNADWRDGDDAKALLGGLRWVIPGRVESGAFVGRRWQTDHDAVVADPGGRTTRVTPMDAFASVQITDPDADQHWTVATEWAGLVGTTRRLYAPETADSAARVRALGGLARVRYDHDPLRLTLRGDLLYLSGDNDPRDDVARTFTAHSDFNVGMLLFEHVLPLMGARAADRISDPALSARPPDHLRFAIPSGAASNTLATNLVARWRPAPPVELRAGWVAARGAGDVNDLYSVAMNGGYNATYGGRDPDNRGLGHELAAGVRGQLPWKKAGVVWEAGLEGALLLPGDALDAVVTENPRLGRARFDVRW
jgi:hypothetical protein